MRTVKSKDEKLLTRFSWFFACKIYLQLNLFLPLGGNEIDNQRKKCNQNWNHESTYKHNKKLFAVLIPLMSGILIRLEFQSDTTLLVKNLYCFAIFN